MDRIDDKQDVVGGLIESAYEAPDHQFGAGGTGKYFDIQLSHEKTRPYFPLNPGWL